MSTQSDLISRLGPATVPPMKGSTGPSRERPGSAEQRTGDLVAGRYQLQFPVGRGGTGTVWWAYDRLLCRRVALKHLAPTRRSCGADALMEARAAGIIRHPNVVSVYDLLPDPDSGSWIVMEALDGESLALTIARDGRVELPVVHAIASALVDALTAMHTAGVVHRDVKPSNVQVCADGRVVLLDLGVAIRNDDPHRLQQPPDIAGTLAYLAPEVVTAARSFPASDTYALGVTLYCALEGVVPFDLRSVQDLVDHAASEPQPPEAPRSGPLALLVRGLLQPRPKDRWSLTRARLHLEGRGGSVGPRTPNTPPRRPTGPDRRYAFPGHVPPANVGPLDVRDPLQASTVAHLAGTAMTRAARACVGTDDPQASPLPGTVWSALTPRELQVVAVITLGATNQQAARRLCCSPHTVSTHLRHVFTKLGVSSRVELTRIAIASG